LNSQYKKKYRQIPCLHKIVSFASILYTNIILSIDAVPHVDFSIPQENQSCFQSSFKQNLGQNFAYRSGCIEAAARQFQSCAAISKLRGNFKAARQFQRFGGPNKGWHSKTRAGKMRVERSVGGAADLVKRNPKGTLAPEANRPVSARPSQIAFYIQISFHLLRLFGSLVSYPVEPLVRALLRLK
jgi:hypothetical protein